MKGDPYGCKGSPFKGGATSQPPEKAKTDIFVRKQLCHRCSEPVLGAHGVGFTVAAEHALGDVRLFDIPYLIQSSLQRVIVKGRKRIQQVLMSINKQNIKQLQ